MEWDIDPIIFSWGPWNLPGIGPVTPELRWYGLCFAIGLLIAAFAIPKYFTQWGLKKKHGDALTLWLPIGLILMAHLVHLIFYEPRSFIDNPRRIIEIGSGLASHGGGLGAILALYLYCRKEDIRFHRAVDAAMLGSVWVIPFVRIGNFFNSEIYGRATDLPWGVIFLRRGFTEARHPSQLYEAALGFALVGLGQYLHYKWRKKLRPGVVFYILLGSYFVSRILIEYVKEYQVISASFPFTMGQMLSMPIVLFCAYMLFVSKRYRLFPVPDEAEREELWAGALTEEEASRDDAEEAPKASGKPRAGKASAKARKKGGAKKRRRKVEDSDEVSGEASSADAEAEAEEDAAEAEEETSQKSKRRGSSTRRKKSSSKKRKKK